MRRRATWLALPALGLVLVALWWTFAGGRGASSASPHAGAARARSSGTELAPAGDSASRGPTPESPIPAQAAEPADATRGVCAGELHGRAVDTLTGEPIPFARLSLMQQDLERKTMADARGRFAATAPWPAGEVMVSLEEASAPSWGRVEHDPAQAEVEHVVRLRAGPTYILVLEAPAEVRPTALAARLRGADGEGSESAAVRDDGATWVRIGWEPLVESLRPPWSLELTSADGMWFGTAAVQQAVGAQSEPVLVELFRQGSLAGSLTAADGSLLSGVRLRFEPADGKPMALGRRDEEYTVNGLPPGAGVLLASAAGFEDEHVAVEIEPAAVRRADVVFGRPLPPGPVAGRVELPAGRSPAGVRVTLYAIGGDERTVQVDAEGLFRFEDVRAGACTVTAELTEAPRLLGDRDLVAPVEEAVLPLAEAPAGEAPQEDPAAPEWIVRARDAASGEPVVNLRVERESATFGFTLWTYDGEVNLGTNLAGMAFIWSLSADGYRPARGDQDSFKTVTEEGRELHLCEARLEPGWGTRARVTDEAGRPVAGVPVLVDGDVAGASEADGRLFLSHPLRPRAIGVAAPWRLAPGGMVDQKSGAFANPFPELELVVAPR